jgi:hypothetical protein
MEGRIPQDSLLGWLKQVTDPQRRQGKVYPLWSLSGMLSLARCKGKAPCACSRTPLRRTSIHHEC